MFNEWSMKIRVLTYVRLHHICQVNVSKRNSLVNVILKKHTFGFLKVIDFFRQTCQSLK